MMPTFKDPETLEASIKWARHIAGCGHDAENLARLADAAEQHLATLPRWKEVEVWRVEWASAAFIPCVEQFLTEEEARRSAHERASLGRTCITVTGPHKQRVPA